MSTFYGIHYSPWSIRGRWALDHHVVRYAYREHLPMVAEPALRLKMRRFRGRITLPAYIDGAMRLGDSTEIARHADAVGEGTSLFGHPDVEPWSARFETLAEHGRVCTTARTASDPEALLEAVPFPLPTPMARLTGRLGVAHLERKYDFRRDEIERREHDMARTLEEARAQLDGGRYLLGDALSFADLSLAAALQFVAPLGPPHVRLGSASLRCWRAERVAESFMDLAAWRDQLVDAHPFVPR
ncbi:MAG: glutathione S-transferase C-terminal domain-containing protein [Sandaracinaceae bacterium]